ncbi:WecB/TagA/CpsF family glycosyltransferase [Sphingorhabdus sp. 109]|uniref:WecB/TagA/CpsF family glycosyltransferase n=1 Tax=Sphingorhabdus sp. 109 TaxID=2653173 RepID=UPI0012F09066|nr:WecB/TagA/CpsF family glycosyltransferase [Sphingorhabdus sp. 109]VWX58408.1 UDP-phosphate galactose phosphotransferase [Sphingorhabdus sp. 109]
MSMYQSAASFSANDSRRISPLIIGRDHISELAVSTYDEYAISLFGLDLANGCLPEIAEKIVRAASQGERNAIYFINAHCINIAKRDRQYAADLQSADLLLPDGSGLRLAGRLAGTKPVDNLNGTDLFPHICEKAAEAGQSIFLLGGKPGIAAAAAKNMRNRYPGLRFAGTQQGYFDHGTDEQIIDQINRSGASILMIGMGVPVQEKWIARYRDRITVPVVMGVGGLFDYYSHSIPRAPAPVRDLGLEWCWRLAMEPRRLAGRYLGGNLRFIGHAIANAFVARGHAERYAAASKRTLDLSIALVALLLLGPLAAAICLLITLEDRGSPFFRQTRIGADGKPFQIWKFRSMYKDAESRKAQLAEQNERDSVCFKMKSDPRITRIGKLIRRTSLDELPQILNILAGQMSVVGPRPALPEEVLAYKDKERGRLTGKPGLTCTWQVSGRADIPFEKQVDMDLDYLSRQSLVRDLILITRTVPAVITGRGAY